MMEMHREFVNSLDVPREICLPLAAIVALATSKHGLLAALVLQMPLQRALPHEESRASRASERSRRHSVRMALVEVLQIDAHKVPIGCFCKQKNNQFP